MNLSWDKLEENNNNWIEENTSGGGGIYIFNFQKMEKTQDFFLNFTRLPSSKKAESSLNCGGRGVVV